MLSVLMNSDSDLVPDLLAELKNLMTTLFSTDDALQLHEVEPARSIDQVWVQVFLSPNHEIFFKSSAAIAASRRIARS